MNAWVELDCMQLLGRAAVQSQLALDEMAERAIFDWEQHGIGPHASRLAELSITLVCGIRMSTDPCGRLRPTLHASVPGTSTIRLRLRRIPDPREAMEAPK